MGVLPPCVDALLTLASLIVLADVRVEVVVSGSLRPLCLKYIVLVSQSIIGFIFRRNV